MWWIVAYGIREILLILFKLIHILVCRLNKILYIGTSKSSHEGVELTKAMNKGCALNLHFNHF